MKKNIFLFLVIVFNASFALISPANAGPVYPDCDASFSQSCAKQNGVVQNGACSNSGRKFIPKGGGSPVPLSGLGGTLGSGGGGIYPWICGSGSGAEGYCCALAVGEICTNISGADCRPDATCAQKNSCTVEGTDFITYSDRICGDGMTCCAPVNDKIAGCVPDATSAAALANSYDETACTALGGLCGTPGCGSFEVASGSVNCGQKDGFSFACCLEKNTCTSDGGYCADSCLSGDTPDATKKDCTKGICCKVTAPAAGSAAGGASGGAAGLSSTAPGVGVLNQANSYGYNPPNKGNVNQIVAGIITKIIPLLGSVMFLMFFYGGVLWMTAAGDVANVKKAKAVLSTSVIGMAIIVGAYILASNLIRIIGASLLG